MNTDVTIILLTHKSSKLVLDYIKNIYGKFRIIVIDNSDDLNLKNLIEQNYPLIDLFLINNKGYGNAANYGSRLVDTEYFLISNPDVKGIIKSSLIKFVKAAKKLDNKFSALGPRYLNTNPKSLKQSQNNKDISELRFLSGACMFFNKKNFDLIGGFDENIFLYFEENDYCKRSKYFFKNYQINNVEVVHDAGNSVSLKNDKEVQDQRDLRSWHFVWSKFYYYRKNYSFIFAILVFIPILVRTSLKTHYYSIKKDKINYLKYKNRLSGIISSVKGEKSHKRSKF